MVRTLFLAASMVGGFFATNDGAQEAVASGFNTAKNWSEERQARRDGNQSMTSEEQQLRDLLQELLEEADFENLTIEEKIVVMEEIVAQVVAEAEVLGVDVTPFVEKFEERVENYALHNTEEWLLFRAYMDELKETYDFENLTPEEKHAILDEVQELMLAKADELGIDITEIIDRQNDRADRYELMNSPEMEEYKAYLQELKESYDFSTMTSEEKAVAVAEIAELAQAKADELGIDLSLVKGQMTPRQQAAAEGFKKGFKAGRAYERSQATPQQDAPTVTPTGEAA